MKRGQASSVAPVRGRLFGIRGAAEYLGTTVSRIYKLLRRGELVAIRGDNGRLQGIYEQDCDAWIARHRQAPAPVPAERVAVDERIKLLMPRERQVG